MKKISPIHYLFACRFDTLVKLLVQNKFKLAKEKRLQSFAITLLSLLTYPFTLMETLLSYLFFDKKEIEYSPVFILGFWRSGTTYLQNILCQDERIFLFKYDHLLWGKFLCCSKTTCNCFHEKIFCSFSFYGPHGKQCIFSLWGRICNG